MRSFITIVKFYYLVTHRRLLPVYLILTFTLAGSYIYLLHNSVYNLQAREVALEEALKLESEIAVLETRSISLLSEINLELAKTLGFTELTEEPLFAERSTTVRVSFLADDQI